ncbi:flavin-containing monooxygenase-like protein [Xylariaceae sp. FL0016]|nr:flavin-containing monooxygenase-like protein [Xylariaceae sp. FL0016]
MAPPDKVAVIGAGVVGLMALKQFKEDGFEVTAFETRPYVGGLWKDTEDSSLSVHETTIFNSSKFRAAVSDFPFPEETGAFPRAAEIFSYMGSYADHFDLRPHVKLSHKVESIVREADGWSLTVRDTATGTTATRRFDRVCIAAGSFSTPQWPRLDNVERFGGKVLHSIDFHSARAFKGERVLIIGLHATAQDVTSALAGAAEKVYLSHRHGVVLLPRHTPQGEAFDVTQKMPLLMLQVWLEARLPALWTWILDKALTGMSSKAFPDLGDKCGLGDHPSLAISTPLVADTLCPFLQSGFAEPVPAVRRILGPRDIELTDGRVLTDIDTIIYCTGYDQGLPDSLVPRPAASAEAEGDEEAPAGSLDSSPYDPSPDGPDPAARNTLAYLGKASMAYSGFVQFELQAMAVSQIWRGRGRLPPRAEMLRWHAEHIRSRNAVARKYAAPVNGTNYPSTISVSVLLPWLDQAAGTGVFANLGGLFNGVFNARAWKLWWEDRELYNLCTKGILSPTVWRVFAAGGRRPLSREEAKKRLIRDNEVCERATLMKRKEAELKGA